MYGDYDSKYVGTALSLARVYQHLGKELKWLWTKDLRVHTVHVNDVARALWLAADWHAKGKPGWDESWGAVPVFNVVDHGDTCKFTPPIPLFFNSVNKATLSSHPTLPILSYPILSRSTLRTNRPRPETKLTGDQKNSARNDGKDHRAGL